MNVVFLLLVISTVKYLHIIIVHGRDQTRGFKGTGFVEWAIKSEKTLPRILLHFLIHWYLWELINKYKCSKMCIYRLGRFLSDMKSVSWRGQDTTMRTRLDLYTAVMFRHARDCWTCSYLSSAHSKLLREYVPAPNSLTSS